MSHGVLNSSGEYCHDFYEEFKVFLNSLKSWSKKIFYKFITCEF
jgi:hypothetical protein